MTKRPTAGASPAGYPINGGDLDRCDSCNAEGRVQVCSPGGGALVFCGHHFHANEIALITWTIVRDTRPQLEPSIG